MTTNYEQQGMNFLTSTGTILTVKFKEYGLHFSEDKDSRDIFTCVLKNNSHRYRFNFGQSIKESDGNGSNPPTAYAILSCIEKYPVYDFEDFCSNYGYDIDSRKAYKTYKAVKREWENVNKLFTGEQLEQLQEIK